jgi:two-component system chemotaxis sensor kinase CheA
MDRDQLTQRLMATFVGELDEHVRALDRDLLALDEARDRPDPERVKTLFRTLHSLKGSARAVNLETIAVAAHRLEERIAKVRDGAALSAEQIELLFGAADALRDAAHRLREQRGLAGSPIEQISHGAAAVARPAIAPAPAVAPRDGATVRVAADKLDRLMAHSGELLVARRRLASRRDDARDLAEGIVKIRRDFRAVDAALRRAADRRLAVMLERLRANLRVLELGAERFTQALHADHHQIEQTAAPLDDELHRARMVPFAETCEGLARLVRDAALDAGNEIDFVPAGGGVEIDRSILEGIGDPLRHLVRNAVGHGIESPQARERAGKPRRGRITVGAELVAGGLDITVADDGRGMDIAQVRSRARERGIAVPDDAQALLRLVFLPGFSTAPRITELSGRGVGLDVVKHQVESLRGTVDLVSNEGIGTRFVLRLPRTLTTLRGLLVRLASQLYALPSANVLRLLRVGRESLASVEGRSVVVGAVDGAPVPVASLAGILGVSAADPAGKLPIAIVDVAGRRVAFAVDELVAEQELVVKALPRRMRRIRHVAGATVLPTGEIALILAVADLVETGLAVKSMIASREVVARAAAKRVLVVDDSVTTRSLEKTILEAAGYDVMTARDGADAWQLLQQQGADLVVSDIEMPRMDGFALTEAIRSSKRFRDLPVILLTALETDRDKVRGLEAGADAYLVKTAFDHRKLLEIVAQLL